MLLVVGLLLAPTSSVSQCWYPLHHLSHWWRWYPLSSHHCHSVVLCQISCTWYLSSEECRWSLHSCLQMLAFLAKLLGCLLWNKSGIYKWTECGKRACSYTCTSLHAQEQFHRLYSLPSSFSWVSALLSSIVQGDRGPEGGQSIVNIYPALW